MNWLKKGRSKLGTIFRRERPTSEEAKWDTCVNCGQMIYHKEMVAAQHVCPHCGHHHKMPPKERFAALFDGGSYDPIAVPKQADDPLKFRDKKKYADRIKAARTETGEQDAVTVAEGRIGGVPTVVAIQSFAFMGGSLGIAAGDAFVTGALRAVSEKSAFVMITSSGGARMQEGIMSLMQMPRTTVAVQMLREARLPYIVVLTDPTTGGVTASYAMLGDIQISEPRALIGFAGPRVIESTVREQLPEGFQRAEFLLDHGMIDMIVHRHDMAGKLGDVLKLLMGGRREDKPLALPPPKSKRAAAN
ncbi:MAG: acetyl-CoA carboxylase, carboxyltransferase subunit beta [Sphingomonadales bacterium]